MTEVDWKGHVRALESGDGVEFPRVKPRPQGAWELVTWPGAPACDYVSQRQVRGNLWGWRRARAISRARVALVREGRRLVVGAWTHPDVVLRWPKRFRRLEVRECTHC